MIPVNSKIVIAVDLSRKVSAENNERILKGGYPMTDAEIKKLVKIKIQDSLGGAVDKLDGLLSIETSVGRDNAPRFGDMMPILRKRLGLVEDDTSRDGEINKYSSEQALKECCTFYLNYPEWADSFMKMAQHCGFVISPLFTEPEKLTTN